jgi:long-chain acyl-CoA synthetase
VSIFVTGGTGYLGGYVVAGLLERHHDRLALLVRAANRDEAERRLWRSLQLHMPFDAFREHVASRVDFVCGDLTRPRFGLDDAAWGRLVSATESIIHVAASLNRRSARVCMDVNLRGSLEVVQLAQAAHANHGLRRFSDVSTTAVAGDRHGEVVREDDAIDFGRSDYDPYARTKKFAEHMIERSLPDVPITVFRPSTVIGDSRFGATSQFDMIRAVLLLARLRVLPLEPESRHDIVPANWVARAIVELHQREALAHRIYHLSAGTAAETHAALMEALRVHGQRLPHRFVPRLEGPVGAVAKMLSNTPRRWGIARIAAMMDVFWPYIVFDTVFDNTRAVEALGEAPAPFSDYASRVADFAVDHDFSYPYVEYGSSDTPLGAAQYARPSAPASAAAMERRASSLA